MSKKQPIDRRLWWELSPEEMTEREKALGVLKEMRKLATTLDRVPMPRDMTPEKVVTHVRGVLHKEGSSWRAQPTDTISRAMNIIEDGRIRSVLINDSQEASKIGRYGNAIKKYLDTANEAVLQPFVGMEVQDSGGKLHTLETRPDMIKLAIKRSPEGGYDVYG